MSILEIVVGIIVILAALVIVFIVLAQDSKGQGLSGVITGADMMSGESRARSKEARLSKMTKVCGIGFFALILLLNVVSVLG